MATPPSAPSPGATATPARHRRSAARFVLRLLFGGKRALVVIPLLFILGLLAEQTAVYWWYRGVSTGTRTGTLIKVSRKGNPLCRYESVEMRVGQQPGAAVVNGETWEFTVDAEYAALDAQLEQAEQKQSLITVEYRQDHRNLPWRYCIGTEYHVTGIK